MITLGLKDAAEFLRLHPEELRRRTRVGSIPGAKIGRAWVFLQEDLATYLRSFYRPDRQALQVTTRNKEDICHFASVAGSGGSTSLPKVGNEYADLLELPKKTSRKSSTIN